MPTTHSDYVPEAYDYPRGDSCLYCEAPVHARRLCIRHYNRVWRHGNPHVTHLPWGAKRYDDERVLLDAPGFWEQVDAHNRERFRV